jgi:hypothetical protein
MVQDFMDKFSSSANRVHFSKDGAMSAKAIRPARFTWAAHTTRRQGLRNPIRNHLRILEFLEGVKRLVLPC